MSGGLLIRFLVLGAAGSFGLCALYSAARNRRVETAAYLVACGSVFVMFAGSR